MIGKFLSRWREYRTWRRAVRGVRPGDSWVDGRGVRHRITRRDLVSGDGFDL